MEQPFVEVLMQNAALHRGAESMFQRAVFLGTLGLGLTFCVAWTGLLGYGLVRIAAMAF
jgi:hypothetical protein